MSVLRSGGVWIPGWAQSPMPPHFGVNRGGEITAFAGAMAAGAPVATGGGDTAPPSVLRLP